MNLLFDTHIYIWWLKDDRRLSRKARQIIMSADQIYVSSVSIWEAAVKIQLGKLDVDIDELVDAIDKEGFVELPVSVKHAAAVSLLPHHHRDPFDRMLIAQAITEPLKLLTVDSKLVEYSELVLSV